MKEPVVFYDGVCGLCNGFVRFLLKVDGRGRLRFAPLQGETAAGLMKNGRLSTEMTSVVLVRHLGEPGETIWTKSAAVTRILMAVGGIWKIYGLGLIVPRWLGDPLYDFIARRRYRLFGKFDSCPMPRPDVKDRFLP